MAEQFDWNAYYARQREYVQLVNKYFAETHWQLLPEEIKNQGYVCHECDDAIVTADAYHTLDLMYGYVIIGCEGYWHIRPSLVGLSDDNWTPHADQVRQAEGR